MDAIDIFVLSNFLADYLSLFVMEFANLNHFNFNVVSLFAYTISNKSFYIFNFFKFDKLISTFSAIAAILIVKFGTL